MESIADWNELRWESEIGAEPAAWAAACYPGWLVTYPRNALTRFAVSASG
jgi:hypothetical protein